MQHLFSVSDLSASDQINAETNSDPLQHSSPTSVRSPPSTVNMSRHESCNDSTPRAKFLKAIADNRTAMHAYNIEDLARLLQDADSAATSENVLKVAISLANNEIRDRLAKAEQNAYDAIESQKVTISALKMEHQAVIDALISAQRDEMLAARHKEQYLMQQVAQLEKRVVDENISKLEFKSRKEDLEVLVQDSALKLSTLDGVVARAASLEKAVKDSYDRASSIESKMKDQQTELSKAATQLLESQTHARSLESSLHLAEANIITNLDVAQKEKESLESIIAQLRLDLNLSRDAVERARAQTETLIGQLARSNAEKSAMVQAHADTLKCIHARSSELEALHNDELAGYLYLQNQLIVSNAAIVNAESRASATLAALEELEDEYAKVLNQLKIEFEAFKNDSQVKTLAATMKEISLNEEINRLQSSLHDSGILVTSGASTISQLQANLQEAESKNSAFRKTFENDTQELKLAKMKMSFPIDIHELKTSSAIFPTLISIANGLDDVSEGAKLLKAQTVTSDGREQSRITQSSNALLQVIKSDQKSSPLSTSEISSQFRLSPSVDCEKNRFDDMNCINETNAKFKNGTSSGVSYSVCRA
jgi:hypothetical protein